MANHITKKKRPLIIQPTTPDVKASWPAWRYHPKTGQGKIFQTEEEVPNGWIDHYNETARGKGEIEDAKEHYEDVQSQTSGLSSGGQELDPNKGTDEDQEPDELEDIADIDVKTIKARLDKREVAYAASANKAQLYQLLEENWIEE